MKNTRRLNRDNLLSETKGLLRRYGLHARKGLAQHFLIDPSVLEKIVAAAELTPEDTALEVGPGLGMLTRELARRAGQVIAVELDQNLADRLKETLVSFKNLEVIQADIMELDPARVIREGGLFRYKVVANLPYYITSAVIRHFLEASLKPEVMIIMVQREIANAITAAPGAMSLLSVSVQFYGRPDIVAMVPSDSFFPPPKVDSAVLKIQVYPRPALEIDNTDGFFRLVRAGFTASRKQIINSLVQGLNMPREEVRQLLNKSGIEATRRSETLSLDEWGRLWQAHRGNNV